MKGRCLEMRKRWWVDGRLTPDGPGASYIDDCSGRIRTYLGAEGS